ncbi:MAG: DUF3365 domain-containing protein [Gammaproteobacteria bacterium]
MLTRTHKRFVLTALALTTLSVYLFVTAPQPLTDKRQETASIPVEAALAILNAENAAVRQLYTKEIVGAGKQAGLKFDEHWRDKDVIAGPLPAQFLRETAAGIEKHRIRLGLYLGSDFAINKANQFTGKQLEMFRRMREDRTPRFFYVDDAQVYAYMFPDIAIAEPCVKCHNDHKDTPKTDWKLDDVMGATTWVFDRKTITLEQLVGMINILRASVRESYELVLKKQSQLPNPPHIGAQWPREGLFLPSADEFMAEVERRATHDTFAAMARFVKSAFPDATRQPEPEKERHV